VTGVEITPNQLGQVLGLIIIGVYLLGLIVGMVHERRRFQKQIRLIRQARDEDARYLIEMTSQHYLRGSKFASASRGEMSLRKETSG
jgi:hypothetical protein